MSEQIRRTNKRDAVLTYLKYHKQVRNVDLIEVGGLRAMARIHELQKSHDITVEHATGSIWLIHYRGEKSATQPELGF